MTKKEVSKLIDKLKTKAEEEGINYAAFILSKHNKQNNKRKRRRKWGDVLITVQQSTLADYEKCPYLCLKNWGRIENQIQSVKRTYKQVRNVWNSPT